MTDTDHFTLPESQYLRVKQITVPHGMFNRQGGTSLPPFSSLNVSYGVGDISEQVAANRERIKQTLGIPVLLSAKQIHGDRIFCASDIKNDTEVDNYDVLMTKQQGVGLLIQQADCQAILIHDPEQKVIAAVHCGWRGSAVNIIGSTIKEMQRRFQTYPAALQVAISPSLGPCCAEFINYRQELPEQIHKFQDSPNHFNFWDISLSQLVEAGIPLKHIDVVRICTVCDRDYFSHRRTTKSGGITTGRNCSAICLPQKQ